MLDFTWAVAGPLCSKLLADHGAQIVRVESVNKPCVLRVSSSPVAAGKTGMNVNAEFNKVNAGKLSVLLNMNHAEGKAIARRLVELSDVVLDNLTPHNIEKWGLTYDALVRIKPDIISVSMPAMGSTGPHQGYRAWGGQIEAGSGLDTITGFPHRPPVGSGTAYPDYSCNPYHTVIAILSALRYRRRTGCGQRIELRQHESTVCFLGSSILDYTANGHVQTREGNKSSQHAPHNVYRCKGADRWCAISVTTDGEWRALGRAMGDPAWAQDPGFASAAGRKANEEELDSRVEGWTSQTEAGEVMRLLQAIGVAAGVVQNAGDLLTRDPQLRSREFFFEPEHPEAGKTLVMGSSFRFSSVSSDPPRRSPLFGEHNDFVFQEMLGMTEEAVNEGMVRGAIQ